MLTFQQLILRLQAYWGEQGLRALQPYDMEVGRHQPHRHLPARPRPRALEGRLRAAQPPPKDGRYGENPNRLQHYYQYQVVLKPAPANILELYLGSLEALGFDLKKNDIRFVEDDWENPTLGCLGPGLGGLAQRHGGDAVHLLPAGRRHRPASPSPARSPTAWSAWPCTCRASETSTTWSGPDTMTYGDVFHQNEVEQSTYNFEHSDVDFLLSAFGAHESRPGIPDGAQLAPARLRAGAQGRPHLQPAGRRGAISVTERAAYIGRIRNLARAVAQAMWTAAAPRFPDGARAWAG